MGGSAHQWSVLLDGDITPGSDFDVRLTVGKVGGTPTRLAWQLSIEEPTVLTAPGEVHDDC